MRSLSLLPPLSTAVSPNETTTFLSYSRNYFYPASVHPLSYKRRRHAALWCMYTSTVFRVDSERGQRSSPFFDIYFCLSVPLSLCLFFSFLELCVGCSFVIGLVFLLPQSSVGNDSLSFLARLEFGERHRQRDTHGSFLKPLLW